MDTTSVPTPAIVAEAATAAGTTASTAPGEEEQPTVDEIVAHHLKHASSDHMTVREHLMLRGFQSTHVVDFTSKQVVEVVHPWQRQALLGRFHAHGLREDSRISKEGFEAALDETLHGRI